MTTIPTYSDWLKSNYNRDINTIATDLNAMGKEKEKISAEKDEFISETLNNKEFKVGDKFWFNCSKEGKPKLSGDFDRFRQKVLAEVCGLLGEENIIFRFEGNVGWRHHPNTKIHSNYPLGEKHSAYYVPFNEKSFCRFTTYDLDVDSDLEKINLKLGDVVLYNYSKSTSGVVVGINKKDNDPILQIEEEAAGLTTFHNSDNVMDGLQPPKTEKASYIQIPSSSKKVIGNKFLDNEMEKYLQQVQLKIGDIVHIAVNEYGNFDNTKSHKQYPTKEMVVVGVCSETNTATLTEDININKNLKDKERSGGVHSSICLFENNRVVSVHPSHIYKDPSSKKIKFGLNIGDKITDVRGYKHIITGYTMDFSSSFIPVYEEGGDRFAVEENKIKAVNGREIVREIVREPNKIFKDLGIKIGDLLTFSSKVSYRIDSFNQSGHPCLPTGQLICTDALLLRKINGTLLIPALGSINYSFTRPAPEFSRLQLKINDVISIPGAADKKILGFNQHGWPVISIGNKLREVFLSEIISANGVKVERGSYTTPISFAHLNLKSGDTIYFISGEKAAFDHFSKNGQPCYKDGSTICYNASKITPGNFPIDQMRSILPTVTSAPTSEPKIPAEVFKPISTFRNEVEAAGYRVAAHQAISFSKEALLSLLKSRNATNEYIASISNLLDTEFGRTIVAMSLGLLISHTASDTDNLRLTRFAKECRIQSLTTMGNAVINSVISSALEALKSSPPVKEIDIELLDESSFALDVEEPASSRTV
jgi:hypothetical protein